MILARMDESSCKEEDTGFDVDIETGSVENGSGDKTLNLLRLMSLDEDDSIIMKKGKIKASSKKPPRPPRPLSLDPCDLKLIKELAIIKRARIKALKQKKNAKISSPSSSSHGSLFAMLFTIIFILVILFQGQNSGVTIHGSSQTNRSGSTVIHNQLYISPGDSVSANYKSSTRF